MVFCTDCFINAILVGWHTVTTKGNRWWQLSVKKKLIGLYVVSIPFIIYGVMEHFQHQSNFEERLDQITIDMMSCETIDKTIYVNSMSLSRSEKVDVVMLNLWFEGNCENPDSPYWRGEDWVPDVRMDMK